LGGSGKLDRVREGGKGEARTGASLKRRSLNVDQKYSSRGKTCVFEANKEGEGKVQAKLLRK